MRNEINSVQLLRHKRLSRVLREISENREFLGPVSRQSLRLGQQEKQHRKKKNAGRSARKL